MPETMQLTYSDELAAALRRAMPQHGQWMTEAIIEAAHAENLNPFIPAAICFWESDFGHAKGYDPKGSPTGWGDNGHAQTPWQIDRRYHATFLGSPAVNNIGASSRYACGLIASAAKSFPGNRDAVIASYNAGPTAVKRAIGSGKAPGSVTYGGVYVARVLEKLQKLLDAAAWPSNSLAS